MRLLIGNSFRTIIWAIAIIVISTLAAIVVIWRAPALKLAARDALVRARGASSPPDEVVIVAIDEASLKRFGRFPWPRSLMAQAINKLSDARPKVIALNVLYTDPTNEADDAALAEAIKRAGNVVVAAQLDKAQHGDAKRPITVQASRADQEVLIRVHNEGTAIPAEQLEHLFEPMKEVTRGGAGDRRHLGLGLYVVDRIAKAHGGEVEVESSPAGGTTFTLRLPAGSP